MENLSPRLGDRGRYPALVIAVTPKYIQDSFTVNFHFPPSADDRCVDVAEVSSDVLELRVDRSTKNIERIRELSSLKKLSVSSMKLDITELIGDLPSLRVLSIAYCNNGYEDLSPLAKLTTLRCLVLCELRNPSCIEFVASMPSLVGLEIENLRKVRDLSPIAKLHKELRELKIETGGMLSGQLPMKSFSPLSKLENLQFLWLYVLSDDRSLEPLSHLGKLKKLCINGHFRWEEYAKLDARLPKTECYWFKKKIIEWNIECPNCGTESKVGLPGKGKRMVCSKCAPKKVDALIACYNEQFHYSQNGNW